MVDWGRVRTFMAGGILGGLLGLILAPRRRRLGHVASVRHIGDGHPFSSAACYEEDDQFT
jgi:hypothetical protein